MEDLDRRPEPQLHPAPLEAHKSFTETMAASPTEMAQTLISGLSRRLDTPEEEPKVDVCDYHVIRVPAGLKIRCQTGELVFPQLKAFGESC